MNLMVKHYTVLKTSLIKPSLEPKTISYRYTGSIIPEDIDNIPKSNWEAKFNQY